MAQNPWDQVPEILVRITAPVFPDHDFDITTYGAVSDGITDCTSAINNAVQACWQSGGGRVIVPPGKYLTGPLRLKSKVNLYVSKGAEVLFIRDPKKYLPCVLTRFEGIELMNYAPLIYAYNEKDIAITGEGVLDGQAGPEYWWPWKAKQGPASQTPGNNRLRQLAKDGKPVNERIFGEGYYLRPNFIEPYQCANVLIEGVTIRNAPSWVVHPVLCTNITIRGIKVISHGPNNDGCDPESCKDVLISDCYFDTGDDCIAIKSGRDEDGRRVHTASENIIIRRCIMKDGHGGVVIGSEISGDVKNVFAEDCEMNSPHLDRALRIKSNSNRGGKVENVFLRNISVGPVVYAGIHIDLTYDHETGTHYPIVQNIQIENMVTARSANAVYIKADREYPVKDIRIIRCKFSNVKNENFLEGVQGLTFEQTEINGNTVKK